MSPNAWGGGQLRGLSQWVQLYTGAQINFGDLTPYLTYAAYEAVFRIREILLIRILGSVHLITDPDLATALFFSDFQDAH